MVIATRVMIIGNHSVGIGIGAGTTGSAGTVGAGYSGDGNIHGPAHSMVMFAVANKNSFNSVPPTQGLTPCVIRSPVSLSAGSAQHFQPCSYRRLPSISQRCKC